MPKYWSGDAAKIRARIRAAITRKTRKKVGESTLGQAGHLESVALYAEALGVHVSDAMERVKRHERHLARYKFDPDYLAREA